MLDIIQWVATIATVIAAFLTAANLGTRITGYGFAVFLVGSLAWLATGIMTGQGALASTNIVLSILNLFGIWRWLGRQAKVEEGAGRAARQSHWTPGEDLFPVSLLTRAKVVLGGKQVGTCVEAMAGGSSGAVRYLVFSEGGVGGVGETLRRADWGEIETDGKRVALKVADVSNLPEVERDRWPAL